LEVIYILKGRVYSDMNNQAVAFIAVVAVVALVFTAAIVTQEADARRRSVHQTSSQGCVNTNARCQNVNSQNSGSDIGSVVIGNQP
jgi:uncharacterized protein YdeI (BOF family)